MGALPDAADYGDAGHRHARPPRRGRRRAGPAGARAPRAWATIARAARRAARRDAGAPRPAAPARPRQGLDDRPLGAHGRRRRRRRCRPTRSGFPPDVVARARGGDRPALLLQPARPTASPCIEDFGAHHLRDRRADPLHLAGLGPAARRARRPRAPRTSSYAVCARVRELMTGEHAVGRVIARPVRRASRARSRRTDGPRATSRSRRRRARYLDALAARRGVAGPRGRQGRATCSPASGSTHAHPGATNAAALAAHDRAARASSTRGLVFTNLVETDQVYGHRKDVEGFHAALRAHRRGGRRLARAAARRRPAGADRRPRLRPGRRRTPTTPASTRRCWRSFAGPRRPPPRRPAGRRRRERAALADGPRRTPTALPGTYSPSLACAMPELPEVETIRRQLAPRRRGPRARARSTSTTRAGARRWRPTRSRPRSRAGASRRCGGAASTSSGQLEDDVYLLMHLRMTGTLLLDPPAGHALRRVRFGLDDGHAARASATRGASGPASCALGAEALDAFFAARLGRRAARRRVHRRRAARAGPRARGRRSRRSCSTSGGSPASATSTPTRRCSARGSIRCARPAR